MRVFKIFILLIFFLSLGGCSALKNLKKNADKEKEKKEEQGRSEWTVDRYYAEAKSKLESEEYKDAAKLYEQLESRYPFGEYAQQSLLESAYAYYKTNQDESAIASINRFIQLYPLNKNLDYAYYLKGLVNFNRGVGIIQKYVPYDETQRDPASAEESLKDFKSVVQRFPNSQYAKDAGQRIVYLRNRLAQHELNVAHYYMRRNAYVGAINRAQYVVENYQRTPAVPEALTIMVRGYKILGLDDLAKNNFEILERNYPGYFGVSRAKELKIIKEKQGEITGTTTKK
ncbi:outer membrane protein assembly factor BamD [Candidatus Nitrosacidococcus sp. I8]|uniref:outer membrane protein assembly factor BamD n=1 Tax=Candidatus Nitrosacidococcus sp. I8 TaxID=2942908 RepID=UPI0022273036|nr:outer membrane protein assembly factor BamD [Candidatus Nitrosacidococcus sp. I8]CAH9019407.1 Outer membrane protein assembly factor BamD [Candidatus Nitrosacidococcus sp. I8]